MQVFRRALISVLLLLAGLLLLNACGPGEASSTSTTVPKITTQPSSSTSVGTTPTAFKVAATGGSLSYQWYRDGSAIAGATAASYSTMTAGVYYVVVSNSLGKVNSDDATLTILVDPVIAEQPQAVSITNGKSGMLSVVATGSGLSYQWFRNSVGVSGATNASLKVIAADSYYVVVSSSRPGAKSVTSSSINVTLSSTPVAPSMMTSPTSKVATAGGASSFSVNATGTDLTYQWFKDGIAIAGATSPSHAIDPVASVNGGSYHAVVTNTQGFVASAPATLTVTMVDSGSNKALVVAAANAFLDLLNSSQKLAGTSPLDSSTVLFGNAQTNAVAWSHLPGSRHGLRLNTAALSATQLNAANALIGAALSSAGATQVSEIRVTDDVIANAMPTSGTGAGLYSIAFIGQPSLTQPWTLQLTGHQLTHNITYNATWVSSTPMYLGAQPPNWTFGSSGSYLLNNASTGTQHAPMETQRLAVSALATAVQSSTVTAAAAKLSVNMTDLMFAPTALGDARFKALAYPTGTIGRGVLYNSLSSSQQAAVKSMIEAWVKTQAADVADSLLTAYEADSALAGTYVAYSPGGGGTADFSAYPNASALPLASANSYIRIDGPRVWIEFLVKADSSQTGFLANTVYYQSVWRDKQADYGGQY
ncbi:MAG: DUF3500 domain-containing protein [Betaproteobacteria bacterium]|nr:DUF3500 domain-containing protein [Betaproteobacteria bacterium]